MENVIGSEMDSMGLLGLMDPITVLNLASRMRNTGAPDADSAQVRILWDAYKDAILEKKLQPFFKDADWVPTFNDLVKETNLPKMTVSAFLQALRAHSIDNGHTQYLDPSKGTAARQAAKDLVKEIVSAPGRVVAAAASPVLDTVSKPLMWVAIAAAAAAVLYVTFQASPFLAAAKKTTKKKKG